MLASLAPRLFGISDVHADAPRTPSAQGPIANTPTFLPAVARLIAIGDLHGDLDKTKRAFRVGGLIDAQDRWCGGSTTAVQVGDQLDRGHQEIEILFFLERLEHEARAAGGALYILNGNHETMNVGGRFTYATRPAMNDFLRWHSLSRLDAALRAKCKFEAAAFPVPPLPTEHKHNMPALKNKAIAARWASLSPGGPLTQRFLAPHPVVLQVGSTLFVHAGVLPEHARFGLERMNRETREWMMGRSGESMPRFLNGSDAVVWARDYSAEDSSKCDCEALQEALSIVPGAERMTGVGGHQPNGSQSSCPGCVVTAAWNAIWVAQSSEVMMVQVVGHTIQRGGITSACEATVLRIDVGLSAGCGDGAPQVLEILNDKTVNRLVETKAQSSRLLRDQQRAQQRLSQLQSA